MLESHSMITGAHLEAYQTAASRAVEAEAEGKDSQYHERQMAAIREIQAAARDIFERYQVSDIEPLKDAARPLVGRVRDFKPRPKFTDEELAALTQDQLQELPFGIALRKFRIEAGLTQDTLATELGGIHQSYITKIERGTHLPRIGRIQSIIDAFGFESEDWRSQLLLSKAILSKKGIPQAR